MDAKGVENDFKALGNSLTLSLVKLHLNHESGGFRKVTGATRSRTQHLIKPLPEDSRTAAFRQILQILIPAHLQGNGGEHDFPTNLRVERWLGASAG